MIEMSAKVTAVLNTENMKPEHKLTHIILIHSDNQGSEGQISKW